MTLNVLADPSQQNPVSFWAIVALSFSMIWNKGQKININYQWSQDPTSPLSVHSEQPNSPYLPPRCILASAQPMAMLLPNHRHVLTSDQPITMHQLMPNQSPCSCPANHHSPALTILLPSQSPDTKSCLAPSVQIGSINSHKKGTAQSHS